jgi:hypothetical protein
MRRRPGGGAGRHLPGAGGAGRLCSDGVWRSLWFAADHPERVAGVVALSVGVPRIAPPHSRDEVQFDQVLDSYDGWAKLNRHYWLRDYPGFVEFFFSEMLPEPHSTKQLEDCVGWALETSPEVMLAAADAPFALSKEEVEEICRRVRAPRSSSTATTTVASPMPGRSAWPSSPARRWSPCRAPATCSPPGIRSGSTC